MADPGFPTGSEHQPKGRFANLLFCIIFAENCIKIKKWTEGRVPHPLDPPMIIIFFKVTLIPGTESLQGWIMSSHY